jgi:hypothetical protein
MFRLILFLLLLAHFIDANLPSLSPDGALFDRHLFNSEMHALTSEATNVFSKPQLNALHILYNSTNGGNWAWETDTAVYGIKWNLMSQIRTPVLLNGKG